MKRLDLVSHLARRVLEVDDFISFHGESVEEFEGNFQTVVDGCITLIKTRREHP